MDDTYYSKNELSKIFTDELNKNPGSKELLLSLWTKIKALRAVPKSEYEESIQGCKDSPEKTKAFVYDLAMYIFTLVRDNEIRNSDPYWSEVAHWMYHFAEKYGEGTLEYQWGIALFRTADEIVRGKFRIPGERCGKLDEKR